MPENGLGKACHIPSAYETSPRHSVMLPENGLGKACHIPTGSAYKTSSRHSVGV